MSTGISVIVATIAALVLAGLQVYVGWRSADSEEKAAALHQAYTTLGPFGHLRDMGWGIDLGCYGWPPGAGEQDPVP